LGQKAEGVHGIYALLLHRRQFHHTSPLGFISIIELKAMPYGICGQPLTSVFTVKISSSHWEKICKIWKNLCSTSA